jgi:transcription antitermination factor NusG
MSNPAWYAAKTCGRETKCIFYLERGGIRAFRPEVHRYFIDKRTHSERFRVGAIFPGYVFFETASQNEYNFAASAIGVAYVLGNWSGERFAPKEMPKQWITDLMDAGPVIEGKKIAYKNGNKVKIAVGHWEKIIAEIDAVDSHGKLMLKVELFGRTNLVRVAPSSVELAD